MNHNSIIIAAGIGLASMLAAAPAQATSHRTFVSPTGDDANPCSLVAPCRNLQAALAQTDAGGEISILGTAGYNGGATVTINKAVSIVNEGGYEAGISVPAGLAGIVISAGATDAVSLRGLTIDGNRTGAYGIHFNTGQSLVLKNCVIRGMTGNGTSGVGDGIYFTPNASSNLFLSDTVVSDNDFVGIHVQPSGSGIVSAVLNHVEVNNNHFSGVVLDGTASNGTIRGTVADSVASSNSSVGFFVLGAGMAHATLTVFHSVATNNSTGLFSNGGFATLRIANSVVTGNTTGWTGLAGGDVFSYGDNYIDGNADSNPGPTMISRK